MNRSTFDVDVAVIGGGPAGACAAIAARRAGARVLLAERAAFPRRKACGCCLSTQAIQAIESLDAGQVLEGAIPIHAVRLARGDAEATIARSGGAAIGRDALDQRLLEVARGRGADVRTLTPARVTAPGTLVLGDGQAQIHAAIVVVADGIAGSSLDEAQAGWVVSRASRMGFAAQVPGDAVQCTPGEIRMHADVHGYVGAVMLPDGAVDVAGAVLPGAVRASGGAGECAARILGQAVRNADALRAARWRGTPELTRRRTTVAGPRLLVAGDAAGYVEPFTGEGIGWAAVSGAAAGQLAARIARGEAREADWPSIRAASLRASAMRCRAIALALRSPWAVRAAIGAVRIAPRLTERLTSGIGRPASAAEARA